MTATMPHADALDVDGLFKRIDARYARKAGDDPAPAAYIKAFADAIRPHLGQPAAPADDAQTKALRADNGRLSDLAEELRKQADTRGNVIDRQAREIADLKRQLDAADEDTRGRIDAAVTAMETPLKAAHDEIEKLRHALTLRTTEIDEARAERDTARAQLRDRPAGADSTAGGQLQTENAELADQLAQIQEQLSLARRDLTAANRTLDEIADEESSRPVVAHRHEYEVDPRTGEHKPCRCDKPWIRDLEDGDEVVPDVEPLDALFDRIRAEWPEPTP